ncbi:hypothetical protein KIN20_026337 [Parelaphostrongylus tenuis]|uniref:Uncharacterized protein n=1 Tax=Parelaphostrongylus tenuis TaxID=148309 RepID=A0AAD5QXX3_PARTN|nr:hypothetical protein KIN20_026337 [Parelaphostrongylus tenuis]
MKEELERRRRAAWAAFGPLKKPPPNNLNYAIPLPVHQPSQRSAVQQCRELIILPRQDYCERLTERLNDFFRNQSAVATPGLLAQLGPPKAITYS